MNPFLTSDVPSYAGLLPYHSVDPEGPLVLLSDNAAGTPGLMGIMWKLEPADTEAFSQEDLGILADRLSSVLETLPEETVCQVILRSRNDIHDELEEWAKSAHGKDTLLSKLASSRARTLSSLRVPSERTVFAGRRIDLFLTLTRKGTWTESTVSPLEALRLGTPKEGAIHERLTAAYLKDRRSLLDLASNLETMLAQADIAAARLSEEEIVSEVHRGLNPGRSRSERQPKDLSEVLMRNLVAGPHL
ncbi:MAG: TraC family protein, partial [Planctomycetota bacterium]